MSSSFSGRYFSIQISSLINNPSEEWFALSLYQYSCKELPGVSPGFFAGQQRLNIDAEHVGKSFFGGTVSDL
jgi:hypothetical protein